VSILPDYPQENLFQYKNKTHPYLYERGITDDVIAEMQVGFDDEHVGIVIPHWFQGKLRGWQIRHLAQDAAGNYLCPTESCMKKGKIPKYKNTTDFPKKNTLYNYDGAKASVQETGLSEIIVVESPFTVLYMKSLGFDPVVATFGSFTFEQAMLLMPFKLVRFWPDNDKAGQENVRRAIDSLLRYSNLEIVPVVEGEKSDAANLDDSGIRKHLNASYPAALYPMIGLTTLAAMPNTNR
jgi:DNA primase